MPNQKSFSTASGLVLTIALVVSWLLALHAASIYSFTTGFFLTRYEVKNFSDSDPVPVPGSFSKAVIIVIDALRFDFALHNFSLSEPYSMPYTNKLPSIFETLRDERQNSYLFRFVADPPTTTMQVRPRETLFFPHHISRALSIFSCAKVIDFCVKFHSESTLDQRLRNFWDFVSLHSVSSTGTFDILRCMAWFRGQNSIYS